jgi:hypothetical protein
MLPGKRDLQKAASKCILDLKKKGPSRVIADVGNPDFWERRAIESIEMSRFADSPSTRILLLQQATSLLILSLSVRESPSLLVRNGQDPENRSGGSCDSGGN